MVNDVTPEMIKVVAEGMGYKDVRVFAGCIRVSVQNPPHDHYVITYNPLTNPAQDSEIEIKLKIDILQKKDSCTAWIGKEFVAFDESFSGTGNTPAEARFMAAYNYFSEVNSDE